jgi:hypothetical protein
MSDSLPEEAVSVNSWSSLAYSIWKFFDYCSNYKEEHQDHSLPLRLIKRALLPHLLVMFCTTYR